MKKIIGLIDYSYGNTQSICNALNSLKIDFTLCSSAKELDLCSHIILPGVGSFTATMESLDQLGFLPSLNYNVLNKKKFFLGICVGFQVIFSEGREFGVSKGLGWVKGNCRKISKINDKNLILPHNGWNEIQNYDNLKLFYKTKKNDSNFYFNHSYIVTGVKKEENIICCHTEYGEKFVSAIQHENIFGVQFHPEKSQENGLNFLKNFSKLK